jgi:hypothetical protein
VVGRLRDFSHGYLQNFMTIEGRLWRSLWVLEGEPGQLTLEPGGHILWSSTPAAISWRGVAVNLNLSTTFEVIG